MLFTNNVRLRSILAAAGLAIAASASPTGLGMGVPSLALRQSARPQATRRIRTGSYSFGQHSYPNGPGWTHAQVPRMATKKRNQAKNRRAHRGRPHLPLHRRRAVRPPLQRHPVQAP